MGVRMAWIPCEDKLFSHPMTARLAGKMGWTINAAGGAILRLRCWCIEFAPDGDLRPFAPGEIAVALGESPADGERVVTALIESQWLENTPYFRVSFWWRTAGLFLKGRFKREPAVWKRTERLYCPPPEIDNSPTEATGNVLSPSSTEGGMVDAGAAPEQLSSDTGAAQGPLAPILSQLIPSYMIKTEQNPQHHQHLQVPGENGIDPPKPGVGRGFSYSQLVQEIYVRAGHRRFSSADEQELKRLAAAHGQELIEACQSLHGGIVNVPAYLRTIFEGSNRDKIERLKFIRFVQRQQAEERLAKERKSGSVGAEASA